MTNSAIGPRTYLVAKILQGFLSNPEAVVLPGDVGQASKMLVKSAVNIADMTIDAMEKSSVAEPVYEDVHIVIMRKQYAVMKDLIMAGFVGWGHMELEQARRLMREWGEPYDEGDDDSEEQQGDDDSEDLPDGPVAKKGKKHEGY